MLGRNVQTETSTGYDLVEIQLDKHRPDAFRLNFAKVPANGIVHIVGPVKAEDVWVHYHDRYCELYASPTFRRWFTARKLFAAKPSADDVTTLIDRVTALIRANPGFMRHWMASRLTRIL